jgi:uncharacterized protein (DUF39 family)
MAKFQVNKTYQEINDKIRKGQAVVVTAEEIIDLVRRKGEVEAGRIPAVGCSHPHPFTPGYSTMKPTSPS